MMIIHGDTINIPVLAIASILTLMVYSYDRYSGLKEDLLTNPERSELLLRRKMRYPYYMASCIGLLAILVALFPKTEMLNLIIYLVVLATVGILYPVVLKSLTKYIPGFKSILVASEWGATIALLYGISYNSYDSALTIIFAAFVFMKLFTLTVFYDIKDIESDAKCGLKTVPVMLGYTNTLRFLKIMTALSWIPLVAGVLLFGQPVLLLALIPFSAFVFLAIDKKKAGRGKPSKHDLLVSLEYLLWPAAIVIVTATCNILYYFEAVL